MNLEEFAKQYNIGYEKEDQQVDQQQPEQQQLQEPAKPSSLQDFAKQFNLPYAEEEPADKPVTTREQAAEAFQTKPVVPPQDSIPIGPQEDLPEDQQVIPPKIVPKDKKEGDKDTVTMAELTNKENLKIIRDYAEARFGDSGKQEEGESDEDYIGRWMTAMRLVEWNTGMNAVPELNWIYNANDQDLLKAAAAHQLYDKVPSFWDKGGEGALKAISEGVFGVLSDPTNLTSFGIGAFAKYKAAR